MAHWIIRDLKKTLITETYIVTPKLLIYYYMPTFKEFSSYFWNRFLTSLTFEKDALSVT